MQDNPPPKLKILIIDNDKHLCQGIYDILDLDGYEAIMSFDPLSSIEVVKLHQPDLIICNMTMMGMDGPGVYKHLKEAGLTDNLPFIFMSATRTDIPDNHVLMKKPFDAEDLLLLIKTRLRLYNK